jgi:hypothetical protein
MSQSGIYLDCILGEGEIMGTIKRQRSNDERRKLLSDAINIIDNALQHAENGGGVAPLRVVAGQLRALIVETRTNHPLLVDLANEAGFPLIVYTGRPDFTDFLLSTGATAIFQGDAMVLEKDKGGPLNYETTLSEAIKTQRTFIGTQSYTLEDIILMIANTEGAHYDPDRPEALDQMDQVELGGLPSQFRTIYGIGRVVRDLGHSLLHRTT